MTVTPVDDVDTNVVPRVQATDFNRDNEEGGEGCSRGVASADIRATELEDCQRPQPVLREKPAVVHAASADQLRAQAAVAATCTAERSA